MKSRDNNAFEYIRLLKMSATENQQLKKIDLEKIIESKNPKLLKFLPKFLINYLKRVIHQDEVNAFIEIHGNKLDFEFVKAVLEYFHINTETKGIENIPKQGGYIFAANHPLGALDAMVFIHELGKVRRDIKFLVNDILMNLENLQNLFIPVNKHGSNSLENLKRMDDVYASDQAVLIYPAGLVSRKQNGKIKDLAWKKSFITRSKKSQKNIVPVYIEGMNTNFFYNLANFRKNIGIKANIEMLYLVDEMFHQKNKTIRIIFGEPISFEIFDKSQTDNQWAQQVKSHVYSLGGRCNEFLPTIKINK